MKVREVGDSVEGGLERVRVTGMEGAGRPRVVSRTWHVIGGLEAGAGTGVAIVVVGGRWEVRAARRWCGVVVGMQIRELAGW